MKIYLETKDKDNHRIVFASMNGKGVYFGEWVRRKVDAYSVLRKFSYWACGPKIDLKSWSAEERPYKPGAFAKNSGPAKKKAVKSTTKKKK